MLCGAGCGGYWVLVADAGLTESKAHSNFALANARAKISQL